MATTFTLTTLANLASACILVEHVRSQFPVDMMSLMDTSVAPCEDFYQFSCGGWLKNTTLTDDDDSRTYAFDIVRDATAQVLGGIIDEDLPILGELWDSCMNLDGLATSGKTTLQRDCIRIATAETKLELLRLAGDLSRAGPSIFVQTDVVPSQHDGTRHILSVKPGTLTLEDPTLYTPEGPIVEVLAELETFASQVLHFGGVDALNDPKTVIEIERKLAFVWPTLEEIRDIDPSATVMPLAQAHGQFPLVFAIIEGLLQKVDDFTNCTVSLSTPGFIHRLEELIGTLEVVDLKKYVAFAYVRHYAQFVGLDATPPLQSRELTSSSRREYCKNVLNDLVPGLLGQAYADRAVDSDRLALAQRLYTMIKQTLGSRFRDLVWMDAPTRAKAMEKLDKIVSRIGRPEVAPSTFPFVLQREDFVANIQILTAYRRESELRTVGNVVDDRSQWDVSAAEVTAFYSPSENALTLPAAILQRPFVDVAYHPARNYGSLGAIVGHELAHAFDQIGRRYDALGNVADWWTPVAAASFETHIACFDEQYANLSVPNEALNVTLGVVDGRRTLNENLADNAGLELAFMAYEQSTPVQTTLLHRRLFFVAFAQTWCAKRSDAAMQELLAADPHAPSRVRVNGAVRNSRGFAGAFGCPPGSPMNPPAKCQCW